MFIYINTIQPSLFYKQLVALWQERKKKKDNTAAIYTNFIYSVNF